jgi:hypothetical protein
MSTARVTKDQRSCEEHVELICAAWQKGVESIIETGNCIAVAQDEVGRGRFEAEVLPKLPFRRSAAYALMAIASHAVLSDVRHVGHLPPHWGTLDALTRVPQTRLLTAIENGEVHPGMERKDVRALLPPPEPEQRDDDLPPDYEGSAEPAEVEMYKPVEAEVYSAEPETQQQPRQRTKLERELDAGAFDRLRREQARNEDLAEKLRAAEIKISGLESEVEELRAERDQLRARAAELESVLATSGAVQSEKPRRGRGRPKGSKNKPKAQPMEVRAS